jgi:outer membrane protein OmpA-like peptidoglycan-associated protein
MKYIYSLLCYVALTSAVVAQEDKTTTLDSLFTIEKTDLSTENTEFGAVLANDNTVYFAQTNSNLNPDDKNKSYLDIYQATLNSDKSFSDISPLTSINSKWHDGTATVTTDGNTMYFASESFNTKKGFEKEKTPAKIFKNGKIYLFKASKLDGQWTNVTPLPFNKVNYSVRNPSISEDGKTLYFSSNMPGGLGGEDIWKVDVDGNSYGEPINLGDKVNSKNNESFPFITSKNVLYFSSNRELGLGGLDVYKIDLIKNDQIVNIGVPINSEKDDFAFTLNVSKKIGFLSSNREQSDDIYMITPICKLIANITVIDKTTKQVITNAKLEVLNDKEIIKSIMTTNDTFTTKLVCEKTFYLKASKVGYEDATHTIESVIDGGEINIAIEMISAPIITEKEVILQEIYFAFDKSDVTEQGKVELDKLVKVMNENPKMVIAVNSHTDNQGSEQYNLNLSQRRANATVQYLISKGITKERVSGKGYGESQLKVNCQNCTIQDHKINRRSEFIIVK